MDFELTDDQQELLQVVHDIAEREVPASLLRSIIAGEDDGGALWKTYVQLDWPSLTIAEADGGIGFGAVELVIALEQLGWAADPTPFLATTSQYAPLVAACGDEGQRRELLGAVCGGGTGAAAFAAEDVRAERTGDGWTLRGTARHVLDGDRAEQVAVVAGTDQGVGVFVVPADDVRATRMRAFDPLLHVADVELDGVVVPDGRVLGGADDAAVERARQVAVAGLAATMVGASQRAFELALDHIKERQQFGVPIGSFQALKHMAVDAYIAIERARAVCQFAGLAIDEDDERRSVAPSMAKAAAGDAQRIASHHSLQFFGGLGHTWENDVHLYVRRAKAGEQLLGTTTHHHAQVARHALGAAAEVAS